MTQFALMVDLSFFINACDCVNGLYSHCVTMNDSVCPLEGWSTILVQTELSQLLNGKTCDPIKDDTYQIVDFVCFIPSAHRQGPDFVQNLAVSLFSCQQRVSEKLFFLFSLTLVCTAVLNSSPATTRL